MPTERTGRALELPRLGIQCFEGSRRKLARRRRRPHGLTRPTNRSGRPSGYSAGSVRRIGAAPTSVPSTISPALTPPREQLLAQRGQIGRIEENKMPWRAAHPSPQPAGVGPACEQASRRAQPAPASDVVRERGRSRVGRLLLAGEAGAPASSLVTTRWSSGPGAPIIDGGRTTGSTRKRHYETLAFERS